MDKDAFLAIMNDALASIRQRRLFETERGYQGELLAMLRPRLVGAALPGDPIVEQEYQKRIKDHGITIRPDIIIHVPFERGASQNRAEGNFAAIAPFSSGGTPKPGGKRARYFASRSISTVESAQITARFASISLCSTGMRSSKANITTPWAKARRSHLVSLISRSSNETTSLSAPKTTVTCGLTTRLLPKSR